MNRHHARARALVVASALIVGTIASPQASAAEQVGPLDVSGAIDGAAYRVVVPANWNGTLLVYGHGYRDKADHAGEVDNRTADFAPSTTLATALLGQGYALAGSAFKDNGWAVKEALVDMAKLVEHFKDEIATPDRTMLWAFSMGSVAALRSMETLAPGFYDGALVGCSMGAGATRLWDQVGGDLALAYDTLFGLPSGWGTFADVRNDLDFETEVQPKLVSEVSNPANFPKFEFLRLVIGTPGRGITPPPPPAFYPGWAFTDMFFATEARAELERRAGGPIYANAGRTFALSEAEAAYLMSLGIPSATLHAWLQAMNGQTDVVGHKAPRKYLSRNSDYSGKIKAPVLTLHTVVDPLVTVSQEAEYAETVSTAGRDDFLRQAYTNVNGHCNFTGPQLLTALAALDSWVSTGVAPTEASFSAALGFVPGFTPPPMH